MFSIGENPSPPTKNKHHRCLFFFYLNPGLNPSAGTARGGRLRALPVADEASKKEWQEHREPERLIREG